MTWYTAHAILYVQFKDGHQDKVPFWENIYLIEASNETEAWQKAEARARQDECDSQGTFTHEGRPARWVFKDIRKVVACAAANRPPTDGTELSYVEMNAGSLADLDKLIAGEGATIMLNR